MNQGDMAARNPQGAVEIQLGLCLNGGRIELRDVDVSGAGEG